MGLPTYKDIVELLNKGAVIEAQQRIMELREAVLELQEENLSLRQKVAELEDELRLKGRVHFDGAVYWSVEEGVRSGPYCQRCLDADKRLVRLQDYGDSWYCLSCKCSQQKRDRR